MGYQFNNKRVWLTGASSGIGLALAKRLLEQGASVAVTSRNESQLKEIYQDYDNALVVAGDLAQENTNQSIVNQIIERFDGLDCVILNAGSAEYIDVRNFETAPFERMMQINFISMVRGIEAALPQLRRSTDPYLVGMSSSVAWQGLPQGQAYSASKAAIRNLFQGLKIELEPEDIAVSWICPGFVETPLTDKNTFDMPMRISVDKATEVLVKHLQKQTTEIHYPKRFTLMLKLFSMLPAGLSAKLLKGTVPER
ncbi:SDR family NAD(P)-dependent oxidoreductase [Aliikangiella marina]|uniref:SDR family NAD(P)-dependent oxidoreductase n=1 Tax=Aliikangiella marina TaxID=1712262 RepID=A0A545T8Q0_9GAMM|nr:SDR family NAD(P)-dependent oxidoreductase [Aliikangiella marina]TQV73592.1 SDR family NAD(P)-dependent oxidoreductase [Aliikangiella marina]